MLRGLRQLFISWVPIESWRHRNEKFGSHEISQHQQHALGNTSHLPEHSGAAARASLDDERSMRRPALAPQFMSYTAGSTASREEKLSNLELGLAEVLTDPTCVKLLSSRGGSLAGTADQLDQPRHSDVMIMILAQPPTVRAL
eukprot:1374148-Amphidinium_carterae.1